ncbi:BnaA10g10340D [Brassica napus]|uniref:BnaA10g10340D protein n=2 Tax=Brassica napus TaxID=3708 RepID=A0A078FS94_BRANA|nr:BnaA10g10340D [Brassica napus]
MKTDLNELSIDNLYYVALDYEAELSRDTKASMEIMGEGWFTLSKERFQTGEILFQPRLAGMQGLPYLLPYIALCMDHCDAARLTGDGSWFKTSIGWKKRMFARACRLEKELQNYRPSSICNGVKVIPPCGVDTAWHGGKLIK